MQRLRWIRPGRFTMGSPKDEEGRLEWELLPRATTIESGFWMFDTPCTQDLWEAVMGKGANPSQFKGADRPVECVSWDDCQDFLKRLNERLEGLVLGLPSEAQWEYACRAGTVAPRYQEDLDEIAWYSKNSGGETHDFGEKAPNAWGLHDMLGNVWEWSADELCLEGPEIDAPRPARPSTHRILRGGSWSVASPDVRAAYRGAYEPSIRSVNLGFRCAEFRSEL